MNRLISAKSMLPARGEKQRSLRTEEREEGGYRKLDEYFKERNVFLNREPKRHSVGKKTLVRVVEEGKERKRPRTSKGGVGQEGRPATTATGVGRLAKTQSVQFTRTVSQGGPRMKRMSSTNLPCRGS